MAAQQMDAPSSFVYLVDNVPEWLIRLADLTKHAADKHAEFVADYTKVVSKLRPERIKSASLKSIRSNKDRSGHLRDVDPQNEDGLPTPPRPVDINPLEAGNKYLYAQAQKKRKPDTSIRSGASGPQKFRSKHQVIIYYDAHLQTELDAMVKAVGIARNNLRKGKNALTASRGFKLPALSRKYDSSSENPSLENLRAQTMSRYSPKMPGKYMIRSASQAPADEDEAAFADMDKMLEAVQSLYETAAHQFLRDGDCKVELNSAKIQLTAILDKAKLTVEVLKEKTKKEEEAKSEGEAPGRGETNSDDTLQLPSSTEPLSIAYNKMAPTSISQTLEDMKTRRILGAPSPPNPIEISLPTAGMTIEVDDDASDDGSFADLDISQFRMNNGRRLLAG